MARIDKLKEEIGWLKIIFAILIATPSICDDSGRRAELPETALLSTAALAKDWNRSEEDAAWRHLQQGQLS